MCTNIVASWLDGDLVIWLGVTPAMRHSVSMPTVFGSTVTLSTSIFFFAFQIPLRFYV